jgi:hypothetical protein
MPRNASTQIYPFFSQMMSMKICAQISVWFLCDEHEAHFATVTLQAAFGFFQPAAAA